jgi:hypothetical protein
VSANHRGIQWCFQDGSAPKCVWARFFQGFPATAGSKYLCRKAGDQRCQLHRYLHRLKPAETGRQWLVLHQISLPADTPRKRNLCKVGLCFEVAGMPGEQFDTAA